MRHPWKEDIHIFYLVPNFLEIHKLLKRWPHLGKTQMLISLQFFCPLHLCYGLRLIQV